ncbi:MAG: amidase [Rubrivivax sp.]
MSLARRGDSDLFAARQQRLQGTRSAQDFLQHSLACADTPEAQHTFLRRYDAQAMATARACDNWQAAGAPVPTLAGLAVSVKDLFDVAGHATTGGSLAMSDATPALADSPVVARLRAAGAALVGHTNLSEFAFSGVGINPHHGTPLNVATARLDATDRVPGGSSSGAASSVACGAAWAALGSDTGGSIRIPAALQGLVGFKNTQRLTPLAGSIPLSFTLDTACAITRSVRDAVLLHEVLAQRTVNALHTPPSRLRLGVPQTLMLDGLEPAVARAFDRALQRLRDAGAEVLPVPLAPLAGLASLNSQGGFSAAEAWTWHRARLAARSHLYDPRVAQRIRRGETMAAADYIALHQARADWVQRMEKALAGFDAMLSPTVPLVAPALAPLLADDAMFFQTNALLLRNPAAVNFLDGAALSLPCQAEGELPVGLMVWGPALSDDRVLGVGAALEALLEG